MTLSQEMANWWLRDRDNCAEEAARLLQQMHDPIWQPACQECLKREQEYFLDTAHSWALSWRQADLILEREGLA